MDTIRQRIQNTSVKQIKRDEKRRKTFLMVLPMLVIFALALGCLLSGYHVGGGAAATLSAFPMLGMAFPKDMKRMGAHFRSFKTEDDEEEGGGTLSAKAEKTLLDKVKQVVNEAIDKKSTEKETLTADELARFKAFYNTLDGAKTMQDIIDMQKNLEEVGLKLKSSEERAKGDRGKGFFSALKDAWNEKADEIKAIAGPDGRGGVQEKALVLNVKAAIVMGEDNTIGSGTTQNSLTSFTGIISQIRRRVLTYLANVSVGTTASKIVYWIEETDEQGTPIFIGEGDPKTQLSVKYVEKTAQVKKIAVYGKVTTEMMADLGQLISYIQNNLMKRMDIVTENQLFSGNNTGDNLNGLIPQATAFAAPTTLALQVPDANEYDVLEAAGLQSKIAFGMPNAWFIHPATRSKMLLLKDTMGQYIFPRWASPDAMKVDGQSIVETTAITEGTFVGGDLTVVNVLIRENATIQIGLDGNDFTNNVKTMLMEQRLVQFISANDTQVLVKGTFSTAIAALVKPT